MNVQTASTKDLVAFYNANCAVINAKPVKKFVNRATAEKRVAELQAAMKPVAKATEKMSPEQRAEQCKIGATKSGFVARTQKEAVAYAQEWSATSHNRKAICRFGDNYLVCSQMTQRKYGYEVVARV